VSQEIPRNSGVSITIQNPKLWGKKKRKVILEKRTRGHERMKLSQAKEKTDLGFNLGLPCWEFEGRVKMKWWFSKVKACWSQTIGIITKPYVKRKGNVDGAVVLFLFVPFSYYCFNYLFRVPTTPPKILPSTDLNGKIII